MHDHFQLQSHILFLSNLHLFIIECVRHIISQRLPGLLIWFQIAGYSEKITGQVERPTSIVIPGMPAACCSQSFKPPTPLLPRRNNHSGMNSVCQRLGLCRFLVVLRIPVNHISHRMIVDNRIESRSLNQVRDCLALRL